MWGILVNYNGGFLVARAQTTEGALFIIKQTAAHLPVGDFETFYLEYINSSLLRLHSLLSRARPIKPQLFFFSRSHLLRSNSLRNPFRLRILRRSDGERGRFRLLHCSAHMARLPRADAPPLRRRVRQIHQEVWESEPLPSSLFPFLFCSRFFSIEIWRFSIWIDDPDRPSRYRQRKYYSNHATPNSPIPIERESSSIAAVGTPDGRSGCTDPLFDLQWKGLLNGMVFMIDLQLHRLVLEPRS